MIGYSGENDEKEARIVTKRDPFYPLGPIAFNVVGVLFSAAFTVFEWPRHASNLWGVPLLLPPFWFAGRVIFHARKRRRLNVRTAGGPGAHS